jgi:CDP-diacylglycerol--glycerol-3-phosphate 3-phosphatidyltransferase
MIGRAIGHAFSSARDALARRLAAMHVTPNMLTVAGTLITTGAGVCYAVGSRSGFALSFDPAAPANAYLLLAGALLVAASACDMLDGAVARLAGKSTEFGAFLDSTLDRFSDFAVYAGIAACYAWCEPANVTFVLLAMLATFNAFMISYTRARAEDLIERCRVGYWQRGERSAAILIGTFAYNIPGMVLQQAALPLLTVLRRVGYTRNVISGKRPIADPRQGGFWLKIRLWRWPRLTPAYEVVTGINIAWLIFGRIEAVDVLRRWLAQ